MASHKPGKSQSNNKKARRQRSLADKQEAAHKNKTKLMSLILVGLMLVSLVGIFASSFGKGGSSDPALNYDGLQFTPEQRAELNNQYVLTTKIDDKEVYFFTMPQDALKVPTTGNISAALANAELVAVTSNPLDQAAPYYDLTRYELSTYSSKSIVGATTQPVDGISLPVLTCENATAMTPVITLSFGNETSINVENNCVFVTSTMNDFAIIRDRLLYTLLGVLNE